MNEQTRLSRSFFDRPTLAVARDLLGKLLVHDEGNGRTGGIILETEAYIGEEDLGCHARAGRTPRTKVMYGPPGCAYVYFTYGMHWMFNVVTEREGFPAAVLVRALMITEGLERVASRRAGHPRGQWTNGPAKLVQALAIGPEHNGMDLCDPGSKIFIETGISIPASSVTNTPRVGLYTVPEPWKSMAWNFKIEAAYISTLSSNHSSS